MLVNKTCGCEKSQRIQELMSKLDVVEKEMEKLRAVNQELRERLYVVQASLEIMQDVLEEK